jgi:pimeloyl-ACP methyl ester carboxylesterase
VKVEAMPPTLVLIHSPFLGPATWRSTADALVDMGRQVHVPSLRVVAESSPPYWPAGVDAVVGSVTDEAVVLVPHSNAGMYVPAIVEALGDQVRGVVFVDAALPGAGRSTMLDFVRRLSVDGLLPPWTYWWDEADVACLFPGVETRAQVETEQPQMPLAYFDHPPPAPDDWAVSPCAYLWFSATYEKGAEEATAYGWPTTHIAGNHLQMLAAPETVAAALLQMAGDWR